MFPTPIHSSSSHSVLAPTRSAPTASEEINAIEENGAHISTAAPYLPPEVVVKILNFLITPYEPIKSVINLYAAQRVNRMFYENTVHFLNNPIFNVLELAEKDISLLENIKKIENDMKGALDHENIESNIKAYQAVIQEFSYLRYQDNEIDYKWNFMLKKSKNVCINLYKNGMDVSRNTLKTLSQRTDIENLSIIADSTFASSLSAFLEQLNLILSNNTNISKINYLSLRRSNINSTWTIGILEKGLSGMPIVTLDLSQNNILDKYAPIFAKWLQTIKIDNLHLSAIGISSSGLLHILDSLPKDLKYLNLSRNMLRSFGASLVFDKLRSSKTKIECVDLSKTRLFEYPSDCEGIINEKGQSIQFIFDFDEDSFYL